MFQRFHVLLKVRYTSLRRGHGRVQRSGGLFQVVVQLLVIHKRAHCSLAGVYLGANRFQMCSRQCSILDRLLAAIQYAARLLEEIGHQQRRFAPDSRPVLHVCLTRRIQKTRRGTDCPTTPLFELKPRSLV